MNRYDMLYEVYADFDTGTLREYQRFVDVFPPVDSRVALEQWELVTAELNRRKADIARASAGGETVAEIAARATREQAFTALDLRMKYGQAVDVLVLDVDETLRSAGRTDNEIPLSTLGLLTDFHEAGVPIVICTGQTLENVKGFMIQGLGAGVVQSGELSIVYEAGTGVFTPGHGRETKRLLYEELDDDIIEVFATVRSRILRDAPDRVRRDCHLQGNEFNVTLKPNYRTGSEEAVDVIERGLVHLLELLGAVVTDHPAGGDWARAVYGTNPEIAEVLDRRDETPESAVDEIPTDVMDDFERIDVGFYPGDAAEVTSLELNKVRGVEEAFDVMGIEAPFAAMLGDSPSDLRVMEWLEETGRGIAAAPAHASPAVLDHVRETDDLVFEPGRSSDVLRIIDAMNRLAEA